MSDMLWAAIALLAVILTVLSLRSAWREDRAAQTPKPEPARAPSSQARPDAEADAKPKHEAEPKHEPAPEPDQRDVHQLEHEPKPHPKPEP